MTRKALIVLAIFVALALLAGVYLYVHATSTVELLREVALAQAQRDTLTVASAAASLVGQAVLSELKLTPEQEATIARLHAEECQFTPGAAETTDAAPPDAEAMRQLIEYRRQQIRDSVRAALSEEQWKKLDASASPLALAGRDWQRYTRTPFAQELLAELDLTDAQKQRLKALAGQYAPGFAALLSVSDAVRQRQRAEALFDGAWNQARSSLTPEQQARVERFLRTHRAEIEAGLRAVWLQGM